MLILLGGASSEVPLEVFVTQRNKMICILHLMTTASAAALLGGTSSEVPPLLLVLHRLGTPRRAPLERVVDPRGQGDALLLIYWWI